MNAIIDSFVSLFAEQSPIANTVVFCRTEDMRQTFGRLRAQSDSHSGPVADVFPPELATEFAQN